MPLIDLYQSCCTPSRVELAGKLPINSALVMAIFKGQLRDGVLDSSYYMRVAKLLTEAVQASYKELDFNPEREAYLDHLEQNIFAFSAAKNYAQISAMSRELTDENGELRSYGAFRQRVTEVDTEFNDLHLQAEYNSAARMGEMANKYDYLQKFEYWEYRTVGDDRVRPSHQKLNGKVFKSSDAIWDTIYPPNDWGCRCTVIPTLSNKANDASEVQAAEKEINPYFKRNLAKEKVVIPAEHPHFISMSNEGLKVTELEAERNYGMPSLEKIYRQPVKRPTVSAAESKEMVEAWFKQNGHKVLTAADGRRVVLGDQFSNKMINSRRKTTQAQQYATEAAQVIEQADEIWAKKTRGQLEKTYIRYYDEHPYLVTFKEVDKKMEFKSMQKGDKAERVTGSRKGQLLYRK
jgi:SPP1 gp7 family putative phage head morphogenesis protein